jgi:predicted small metal-binding protein
MGKLYRITCRDAGVDCDFEATGSNLDELMRQCVRVIDDGAAELPV